MKAHHRAGGLLAPRVVIHAPAPPGEHEHVREPPVDVGGHRSVRRPQQSGGEDLRAGEHERPVPQPLAHARGDLVGRRVLRALRDNEFYIFTHPEYRPVFAARFDAILASEPQDGFPEARAKAETRVLTAPPYAPEIAHRTPPRKSYRS